MPGLASRMMNPRHRNTLERVADLSAVLAELGDGLGVPIGDSDLLTPARAGWPRALNGLSGTGMAGRSPRPRRTLHFALRRLAIVNEVRVKVSAECRLLTRAGSALAGFAAASRVSGFGR